MVSSHSYIATVSVTSVLYQILWVALGTVKDHIDFRVVHIVDTGVVGTPVGVGEVHGRWLPIVVVPVGVLPDEYLGNEHAVDRAFGLRRGVGGGVVRVGRRARAPLGVVRTAPTVSAAGARATAAHLGGTHGPTALVGGWWLHVAGQAVMVGMVVVLLGEGLVQSRMRHGCWPHGQIQPGIARGGGADGGTGR